MAPRSKAMNQQRRRGPIRAADLPEWPPDRPVPKFKTEEEFEDWFRSYSFADVMDASEAEELVYEPPTRKPRPHVFTVRLNDQEAVAFEKLARVRGLDRAGLVRAFIRESMAAAAPESEVLVAREPEASYGETLPIGTRLEVTARGLVVKRPKRPKR